MNIRLSFSSSSIIIITTLLFLSEFFYNTSIKSNRIDVKKQSSCIFAAALNLYDDTSNNISLPSSLNRKKSYSSSYQRGLLLHEFQDLLGTEVDHEVKAITDKDGNSRHLTDSAQEKTKTRKKIPLSESDSKNEIIDDIHERSDIRHEHDMAEDEKDDDVLIWEHIVNHGWSIMSSLSSSSEYLPEEKLPSHNHGRFMGDGEKTEKDKDTKEEHRKEESLYPFLVCSSHNHDKQSSFKSGYQRIKDVVQNMNIISTSSYKMEENDVIIVSNQNHQTCFYLSSTFTHARSLNDNGIYINENDSYWNDDIVVITPMVDLMKLSVGTIEKVTQMQQEQGRAMKTEQDCCDENEWESNIEKIEDESERKRLLLIQQKQQNNEDQNNVVECIIHVHLTPGIVRLTKDEDEAQIKEEENNLIEKAKQILKDLRDMAQEGSKARQRKRDERQDSINKRRESINIMGDNEEEEIIPSEDKLHHNHTGGDESLILSITDSFSLTTSLVNNNGNFQRKTAQILSAGTTRTRAGYFSSSLELGIEADHCCQYMLDTLIIRPIMSNKISGFDLIINSTTTKRKNDDHYDSIHEENYMQHPRDEEFSSIFDESSSSCIVSLIIGLSIHSSVLNIEVDSPITLDDFQSQWITQSNSVGSRPLFDVGLTGNGQVVSISDSGLDVKHPYFGPTSDTIFHDWDMSERKVIRYDHKNGFGDTLEEPGGHGTRVAGVVAGRINANTDSEADGIARDAKLHFWDLKGSAGGYTDSGPYAVFGSMQKDAVGCRISNGSWSAPTYGKYTTRCRLYDNALHEQYSDVLFVTSAGNRGNDVPGEQYGTIGDPASCKNTLAVGASQSYGNRLFQGDKGREYLGEFSSRGPTQDGRIKPDIVAPGYTVLTARAHSVGNNAIYETYGTSFSAPVAAGNAALIRQYFEEGWYPCGEKRCGEAIYPSGALVKAVLMNGAQNLKRVQRGFGGVELENIEEYDFNQGMGLINMLMSLPLKNKNSINALVVDYKEIAGGDVDTITVKAHNNDCSSTQFSTVLAWYDPPGALGCKHCLVDDFDLMVEEMDELGGTVKSIFYPNGLNEADNKNNSERVRFKMTHDSKYRITVKASNLSSPTSKYSLIVTGCFEEDVLTSNPTSKPTKTPSSKPTSLPSYTPTERPSNLPSDIPSNLPSEHPTYSKSKSPSKEPSDEPSNFPTAGPSNFSTDRSTTKLIETPSIELSFHPTILSQFTSTGPTYNPEMSVIENNQISGSTPKVSESKEKDRIPSKPPAQKTSRLRENFTPCVTNNECKSGCCLSERNLCYFLVDNIECNADYIFE